MQHIFLYFNAFSLYNIEKPTFFGLMGPKTEKFQPFPDFENLDVFHHFLIIEKDTRRFSNPNN